MVWSYINSNRLTKRHTNWRPNKAAKKGKDAVEHGVDIEEWEKQARETRKSGRNYKRPYIDSCL